MSWSRQTDLSSFRETFTDPLDIDDLGADAVWSENARVLLVVVPGRDLEIEVRLGGFVPWPRDPGMLAFARSVAELGLSKL